MAYEHIFSAVGPLLLAQPPRRLCQTRRLCRKPRAQERAQNGTGLAGGSGGSGTHDDLQVVIQGSALPPLPPPPAAPAVPENPAQKPRPKLNRAGPAALAALAKTGSRPTGRPSETSGIRSWRGRRGRVAAWARAGTARPRVTLW